jgi:8-amino-7-oxononanoate synthase
LHLFWDLFGILAGCRVAIYLDAGAYPIAWWGVERAAGRGVPVYRFPHQDVLTLQQLLLQHPPYLMPVVVADGLCAACGCLSRLCPPRRGLAGAGRHPGPGASWCPDVLVISSLAKGFGAPLAALSGSRDAVQQFEARSQTRTHCSPPSVAAIHAADHALKINADHGDALRAQLARRIQRFRRRLAEIGLTAQGGLFPVQTLKLPLSLDVKGLHRQLLNFGVKTVLRHGHNGNAQVSFIITARHRPGEIDQAVRALAAATRVQSPGQSTGG